MGSHLGKYQLVAEIARGGMGIVYLAVAQGPARFNKLLVVKELKPELVEDENFLEMFLEEARLAARLSHPNIVQTYEVGEEDKRHYIVMDYLDGVTLARLSRRKSPAFTRNMQLRVICETLAGLHYAHTLRDFDGTDLGIVHRDVTPENVFLTFDGTAKLVDFGIAKTLDSSIHTRTGVLKGKPSYMSPEQIGGKVDPRADVFSAGVMIWEAAVGRRMWAKKSEVEVLTHVLKGEIPDIPAEADVPEELARIIERALARDRDDRFPSAAALQDALERFLASDPTATMREVGKVVSAIFAKERTSMRAAIDTNLARLKSGAEAERPPALLTSDGKAAPESESRINSGVSAVSGLSVAGTSPAATLSTEQAQLLVDGAAQRGRRGRLTMLFAAAILLPVIGFAVGLGVRGSKGDLHASRLTPDTATAAPTASATPLPSGAASEPSPTELAAGRTALPTASVDPGKADPLKPASRPTWTPPSRTSPASHAPSSNTAPAPSPEARNPDVEEGRGKTGYLTLDTYPWTRVSTDDGRVIGDTPLVRVPLPVGSHVLVLENPAEQLKQTTTVTIKAGETLSKRLAF